MTSPDERFAWKLSPEAQAQIDDARRISRDGEPIHLTITETEPAAWQRYDDRLGWTPVDERYAKTLAAGGVTVRRLYPAEQHIALVEKIAKMRSREELAAMGFPSLPSEGLHLALDEVIQQARALVQERAAA